MDLRGMWLKLRALVARERLERELDDELRFHLEMEAAENVRRGMSPEEARRRAAVDFGGVERWKESAREARGVGWLEDLVRDLRHAVRSLLRSPAFALTALLTLALGVGLNAAIHGVVSATVLAPFPYPDADRLRVLGSTLPERGWDFASLSLPEIREIDAAVDAFETVAAYRSGVAVTLDGDGTAERLEATFADSRFLPLMGAEPVRGRLWGAEVDAAPGGHPVVVVSHDVWVERLGGREDAVGSTLVLSGAPYSVIGVLPPGFHGLTAGGPGVELWLPLSMGAPFFGDDMLTTRTNRQYLALTRVADGVEDAAVDDALAALAGRLESAHPQSQTGRGITAWELRRLFHGRLTTSLAVLLGGAVLVLLVCAANVAALFLVRAASRTRELALRTVLGARRGRLVRQLLTEAALLAGVGGVAGLLVAHAALPAFLAAFEVDLPALRPPSVDARVLLASLGVMGVLAAAVGVYPALRASRVPAGRALTARGEAGGGPGAGTRWSLLVGAETALAVVLLVGAGLMVTSLQRLAATPVGYDSAGLLTLRMDLTGATDPDAMPLLGRRLLDEVRALPEVEEATLWGPSMLGRAGWHLAVSPPDADPTDPEARGLAQRLLLAPGGLETLRIPLLRGRTFTAADLEDGPGAAVIDRRLAETFWPEQDPVGRVLTLGSTGRRDEMIVVGVVEEARHRGRRMGQEGVVGDVYLLWEDMPGASISLLVRPRGDAASTTGTVAAVRRVVERVAPGVPLFDVASMTDRLRREETTPRFTASLMGVYAATAVLLALVGVYGVLAYTLRERRRELAVRRALGARPGEIAGLALRRGLLPALVGAGAGVAGALLASGTVEGLLYGVDATDPRIYAMVVGAVVLAAAVACVGPARRAATVEPMAVLREE